MLLDEKLQLHEFIRPNGYAYSYMFIHLLWNRRRSGCSAGLITAKAKSAAPLRPGDCQAAVVAFAGALSSLCTSIISSVGRRVRACPHNTHLPAPTHAFQKSSSRPCSPAHNWSFWTVEQLWTVSAPPEPLRNLCITWKPHMNIVLSFLGVSSSRTSVPGLNAGVVDAVFPALRLLHWVSLRSWFHHLWGFF